MRLEEYELVEICLKRCILRDQYGLAIFLNHLEVIGRIYTALKEDPEIESLSDTLLMDGL